MVRKRLLLALLIVCTACLACATNPFTGKNELMLISEEQEIELGRKYAPEIEKQMGGRIPDPLIQSYIDRVGRSIVQVSHRPDLKFHFLAVQHKSINALALPGGHIYVTRGMLENLQSEAELAGILAHEIAHVVARDVGNAMSRQIGLDLLLSATTSKSTSPRVLTVAQLAGQIITLRFSRQDEREADLAGLDYLVAAGYNPYAMVEALQMLLNTSRARPPEFLSTHPSPENRIAYLQRRIRAKNYNLTGAAIIGRDRYHSAVLARLSNRG